MNLNKPILAQITNPVLKENPTNPDTYVNGIIQTIITLLIMVGILFFLINFILSAYHMMSSKGDPKKFEEAQKSLTYSLLGIVLIFIVFAILKIVGAVFGVAGLENLSISWPSL